MEAFIVEADDLNPWVYVRTSGYEVLSKADSWTTRESVSRLANTLALERELVPATFWRDPTTPPTLILFAHSAVRIDPRLAPGPGYKTNAEFDWVNSRADQQINGDIEGSTLDTFSIARDVSNIDHDRYLQGLDYSAAGLPFRLSMLEPVLPRWFFAGICGPYGLVDLRPQDDGYLVPGPVWISLENTREILAIGSHGTQRPESYSIAKLFEKPMGDPAVLPGTWESEAALFLRWGYFSSVYSNDSKADPHAAFLQFLNNARHVPVTEEIFKESFGFGYDEMNRRLAGYLISAAREPVKVNYKYLKKWPPNSPEVVEHVATISEIARVLGGWELMTGQSLKRSDPVLGRRYVAESGRLLKNASAESSDDPGLTALAGLYQAEVGNTNEAKILLQKATHARTNRTMAYLILAKLRLESSPDHSPAQLRKLTVAEVSEITEPLFSAARIAPLPEPGYVMICQAYTRSAVTPSLENLKQAAQGLEYFPLSPRLILSEAELFARAGDLRNARSLVARGERLPASIFSEKFLSLEKTLADNAAGR